MTDGASPERSASDPQPASQPSDTSPPLSPAASPDQPPHPSAPEPAPGSAPAPGAALEPGSWWGAALALLTLIAIIVAIVAAWQPVGLAQASAAERYLPLSHGLTLSYRVTHPDGSVTYQSSNTARRRGTSALNQLPTETQLQVMLEITGESPDEITVERFGEFLRTEAAAVALARSVDTDYDATGAFTATESLLLVRPTQVDLLVTSGRTLTPPLPLFDIALAPGASRVVSGTLDDPGGGSAAYTATLELAASEPLETPAGRFEDCRRMRVQLSFESGANESRSWYCAGVGLAYQEYVEGESLTRYELVGGLAPELQASVERPQPVRPDVDAAPPGQVQALPAELEHVWSFREPGFDTHITSAPLAAGDMLIYGTQNGGLLAIDRATHQLRWRFQTGGAIYGTPAVAGGVVYVASTDRRLYALDLAGGTFRWAFTARDAISAPPAVAGGVVYLASEDRTLYALDAASGAPRWSFASGDAIAVAPVVADGAVYLGADDGALYALDAASGALRWAFGAGDAIGGAVRVAGGVVYAGSYDGVLYALRAATDRVEGELIWSYDAGDSITADLALGPDTIYLKTASDELRAVDLRGGERWRYADPTTLYGAPLLAGEQVFINRGYSLLALDAAGGAVSATIPIGDPASYHSVSSDGRELFVGHRNGFLQVLGAAGSQPWVPAPLWRSAGMEAELFAAQESLNAPPVRDGDRLLFVGVQGGIYAVNVADGTHERLGLVDDLEVVMVAPVLAGDLLLVSDQRGHLAAFDLRSRSEHWRADLGGLTFYPPAISGDLVLTAAAAEGGVVARGLDLASGREVWRRDLPSQYQISAGALLVDGQFIVAAEELYALDPATGEVRWQPEDPFVPIRLSAADGVLYALGFNALGGPAVAGWEAASGERRMAAPVALDVLPAREGGMAAGQATILLALSDRTLIAVDAASGDERWRTRLPAAIAGPPVVAGGVAIVVTLDNHLLGFAIEDGRLVGDFALQSASSTSLSSGMAPLVEGGRLYAAFYQSPFALELR